MQWSDHEIAEESNHAELEMKSFSSDLPWASDETTSWKSNNSSPLNDCIVDRLRKGDSNAFTIVYDCLKYSLLFYAQSKVKNLQDAEDICAEVFIKAWQNRTKFVNADHIRAFFFVSVKNACLNTVRNKKREASRQQELVAVLDQFTLPDDAFEVQSEYKIRLLLALELLPEQPKKVFKLAFFDLKKNDEIAGLLRIDKLTVKNHKVRALRILRLANAGKDILLRAVPAIFLLFRL